MKKKIQKCSGRKTETIKRYGFAKNDEEDIFELDEFNAAIDDANINNGKASWENNNRNRSKKKQNHNHGRNSNDNNINNMETDEAGIRLGEMMFLVLEYLQKRIESANQIIGAAATGDENYRNAKKSIERLREALVSRAFFTTLLPAPKSKFANTSYFISVPWISTMVINKTVPARINLRANFYEMD